MRAKAFLAQGFQLQDSVKISSQKIWPAESEASITSEDSNNADKMHIELLLEDVG